MINTGGIIMQAYLTALSGISANVFFGVPKDEGFPYVLIDNINERGGEDVATRTKQNRNASEVEIVLQVVTGFTGRSGAKQADDIATEILAIVLPTDPTSKLDFSPINNVTASLESTTYSREFNDTRQIITKEITINHLLSQP